MAVENMGSSSTKRLDCDIDFQVTRTNLNL